MTSLRKRLSIFVLMVAVFAFTYGCSSTEAAAPKAELSSSVLEAVESAPKAEAAPAPAPKEEVAEAAPEAEVAETAEPVAEVAAMTSDEEAGSAIFAANCAACHAGGKNLVNPAKTLQKSDLEKYGMYSKEAIVTQVTNGKGAMPAFQGRIPTDDIPKVASYVLYQADNGWK